MKNEKQKRIKQHIQNMKDIHIQSMKDILDIQEVQNARNSQDSIDFHDNQDFRNTENYEYIEPDGNSGNTGSIDRLDDFVYAIRTMNTGLLTLNRKGVITFANPMACKYLGIQSGKQAMLSDLTIYGDQENDAFVDLITGCILNPNVNTCVEIPFILPTGEERWLQVNCTRKDNNDTVITFIERTMLKKQEDKSHDSAMVLVSIIVVLCIWAGVVALWQFTDKPITLKQMTNVIEIAGLAVMVFILRRTNLTLRDMGLSIKNLKQVLLRDTGFSIGITILLMLFKLVIMKIDPGHFDPSLPFWDWNMVKSNFLTYFISSFIQEFMARGAIQGSISCILPWKNADSIAIFITSLFFMALHVQNGFLYSIGAFFLSVMLGYIYKKDKNIYGITIIHYTIGMLVDILHLLGR